MKSLHKIIVAILVFCICFILLGTSVYAYGEHGYATDGQVLSDTVYLINSYSNGEISYDDFVFDLNTIHGQALISGCDYSAYKVQQFIDTFNSTFSSDPSHGGSEHGGGGVGGTRTPITDMWNDICNNNDVPTDVRQIPTTDLMGGGAKAVLTFPDGKQRVFIGGYIIVDASRGTDDIIITVHGDAAYYDRQPDGTYKLMWTSGGSANLGISSARTAITEFGISDTSGNIYKLYGDVRTIEGESFPTDDEYEFDTVYNFDDMTDTELKDLIEQLANEIQVEYPDLSTMEGLLKAIYGRLGKLDSDDDNGLLSAINAAIISLASDNNASNAEIIGLLQELKDSMKNGTDLDPVLKELNKINDSLDYLKTISTLDLIGDTIESLLELTDTEKTFLDTYATLILNLITKLGYAPVTAMINNLEALVLNGTPPQDLVINVYDTQVVLLSTSTFEKMQISGVLNLAKLFVSVLLAISWLYSMRKKITGGA